MFADIEQVLVAPPNDTHIHVWHIIKDAGCLWWHYPNSDAIFRLEQYRDVSTLNQEITKGPTTGFDLDKIASGQRYVSTLVCAIGGDVMESTKAQCP